MKNQNPKFSPESPLREVTFRVRAGSYSWSKIRWRCVFGAAFAVIALSFLVPIVIISLYAFVLAFQARGTPDQTAINHFAANISPKLMPWLEVALTFLLAFRIARRNEQASIISGLIVGIMAGLLSLAVTLAFGGRFGLRTSFFALIIVALGWLGGYVGQTTASRRRREDPRKDLHG